MAHKTAPLFRKSINGYNKEDVNEYIININRTLEDNKQLHEKELSILEKSERYAVEKLSEANAALETKENELCEVKEALEKETDRVTLFKGLLEDKTEKLEEALKELEAVKSQLSEKEAALSEKEALIEKLSAENEERSSRPVDDPDTVPADQYNSLCAKAGEILVIASTTAEDILKKANEEAVRIINDAADKRETIIKSFNDTVDTTAHDINAYIKGAVDDCVKKINKTSAEATQAERRTTDKQRSVSVLIKRR